MMNPILIKAFGVCTQESKQLDNKEEIFNEALKRGFLIPVELINEDVLRFIESESVDYNSTFYKNWEQMKSKNRLEQYFDQIFHYMTTYGTGFQSEFVYTCNDEDRSDVPDFKTYKIIEFVGVGVVVKRCIDLLTSGIAMSNDLVSSCVDYIIDHSQAIPEDFIVDDVQNREAMTQICDKLNIHPKTAIGMVRWMVYKATGDALLIKDKQTLYEIKVNADAVDMSTFSDDDLKELSKVFFRFKPIFLAFKACGKNCHVVNTIRRYADKYHTPMKSGFWQTVLSEKKTREEILSHIDELNNFKIISLIQTISERILLSLEDGKNIYIIRNGSAWVDNNTKHFDIVYLINVKTILYSVLIKRLSVKAGIVRFPKNINIACPVSEKKFAGNLPYGSSYGLSDHNYFGIYWKEEDGTRDFDLSFVNKKGVKIGWNGNFRDGNDVLFSGDMTTAVPCATEVIYFKGGFKEEGVLWNNRFLGKQGSKFRYFMGSQKIDNFDKNYMVDPNTVEFEEWTTSENTKEMLGVVMDNKIYPCKFGFGSQRISGYSDAYKFEVMKRELTASLHLKDVLLDAGFIEWVDDMCAVNPATLEKTPINPDYDFTNLDKDTLIALFS